MYVVSELERLKQEDCCEFEDGLGYRVRPGLKGEQGKQSKAPLVRQRDDCVLLMQRRE